MKDDGAVVMYQCVLCRKKNRAWIEVIVNGWIDRPSCCVPGYMVKL
jgi:hypothetical protein